MPLSTHPLHQDVAHGITGGAPHGEPAGVSPHGAPGGVGADTSAIDGGEANGGAGGLSHDATTWST